MSARTYIYNIILILFYAIEENLLAGKGTHVDVGIRYGIVAETGNASETNDIHLAIALDEALGLSFRLKMAEVVARLHDNGIARSRLPEPSFGVLEDTAVVVVVGSIGKAFCRFHLPFTVDKESSITGCSHKDASVSQLQ